MQLTSNNKLRFEPPASALARYDASIVAAAADKGSEETTLNIYSEIGDTWDGTGMTPKIVSSVLRQAGGKDLTVNINSPGGSFFDGLAIYTLLKDYSGKVNVRVIGMAASAASVIALAGTNIEMAPGSFMMIHNAWTIAMGNRHDMTDAAGMLGQFDQSMIELYANHTGLSTKEIASMMDAETWISAADAIDKGFADSLMEPNQVAIASLADQGYNAALKKVDLALAKSGVTRSERRNLIKDLTAKPGAGSHDAKPGAGVEVVSAIVELIKTLKETKE